VKWKSLKIEYYLKLNKFRHVEDEIFRMLRALPSYHEENLNTTSRLPFSKRKFKCAVLGVSGISWRLRPFGMLMRDYGGHGRNTRTFCAAHVWPGGA